MGGGGKFSKFSRKESESDFSNEKWRRGGGGGSKIERDVLKKGVLLIFILTPPDVIFLCVKCTGVGFAYLLHFCQYSWCFIRT